MYKMWYNTNKANWTSGSDRYRLGYATSENNNTWLKYSHVLKGDSNIKAWDNGGLDRGFSILHINSIYHLWYTATGNEPLGSNTWKIGYATSPDGINWTKQNNGNPVLEGNSSYDLKNVMYPYVLYEDGFFKMLYGTGSGDSCSKYIYATSPDGIIWTRPANNPSLEMTKTTGDFDAWALSGHTILRDGDIYKMWYSGHNGERWSVGYATASADMFPTPPPLPKNPIIIIPGIFASWNKEAILEGQKMPSTPWKPLYFITEYDGIIKTLKNLGYEEGKTLFLWSYDWRKPVLDLTGQFDQYIKTVVKPTGSIEIIGHSLGGIIGRSWTQTGKNKESVHHLITVASPNQGVIQPYRAWEGGEVTEDNTLLSFVIRIIVELNRRMFTTPREAIQDTFPVLKDLLPTDPYLKKQSDGTFISASQMTTWNSWLTALNASSSGIYPLFDAIVGTSSQTPYTYTVTPKNWIDSMLGNWNDGKPVETTKNEGDGIVAQIRANFLDDPATVLSKNHNESIASKEGIDQILALAEIPHADTDITESQTTKFTGILFLMRSPATFRVQHAGKTYEETDGILYIPNAVDGSYQVTITGTGAGIYHFTIGQFTQDTAIWKEYTGSTAPGTQTTYTVSFDTQIPKPDPVINLSEKERLSEIDTRLIELQTTVSSPFLIKARFDLSMAQFALIKGNYPLVKSYLETILLDLSQLRMINTKDTVRLQTLTVADTLIDTFQMLFKNRMYAIPDKTIQVLRIFTDTLEKQKNTDLEKQFTQGKATKNKTILFTEGKSYKAKASATTPDQQAKKYILLYQTQLLFKEIK